MGELCLDKTLVSDRQTNTFTFIENVKILLIVGKKSSVNLCRLLTVECEHFSFCEWDVLFFLPYAKGECT